MATVTTVTVKPSGGDYSTLAAAEAGEQTNLVTADVQLDIECSGNLEDTTAVSFDGWTTDATRYIRVFTPQASRHAGKWDGTKYRHVITSSSNGTVGIKFNEDFCRIEGIQCQAIGPGNQTIVEPLQFSNSGGANCTWWVDACIVVFKTTRASIWLNNGSSGVSYIRNTLIYGDNADNTCYGIYQSNGTGHFHNVTIVDLPTGVHRQAGTVNCKNVGVSGASTAFSGTITQTTCSSSTPTFVDSANKDFRLASGDTTWKDQGTDLSSDSNLPVTTDIEGETRSGSWDIGADEYVSAGGGVTVTPAAIAGVGTSVDPSVVLGGLTLFPPPASGEGESIDPVTLEGGITVTPSPVTGSGTTVDPTVILGPATVTPVPVVGQGQAVQPVDVELGEVTVTPTPEVGEGTTADPTVELGGITLTPTPTAGSGTTVDPEVQLGPITLTPTPTAGSGTTVDPEVQLGGITLTPTPEVGEGTTVDPEVNTGGTTVTPPPAIGTGTTVDPVVVYGPVTVTPVPVTGQGTTVDPVVLEGGTTVTPPPAIGTGTTPPPVVELGELILVPLPLYGEGRTVDPLVELGPITVVPTPADGSGTTFGPEVGTGNQIVVYGALDPPADLEAGDEYYVTLEGPSVDDPRVVLVLRFCVIE